MSVSSGPVSGLQLAKKTAEPEPSKLEPGPVKKTMKKQPFFTWICKWKVTQRRECGLKIEGPTPQTVERNRDLHWEKHQREAYNKKDQEWAQRANKGGKP